MIFIKLNVNCLRTHRAHSHPLATEPCAPVDCSTGDIIKCDCRFCGSCLGSGGQDGLFEHVCLLCQWPPGLVPSDSACVWSVWFVWGCQWPGVWAPGHPFQRYLCTYCPLGRLERYYIQGGTHSHRVWCPGDPGTWTPATGRLLRQLPSSHSQVVKVKQWWPGRYSVRVLVSKLVTKFLFLW